MSNQNDEIISQLASSSDEIRYHGSNAFVAQSFLHPEKVLRNLNDLTLVIYALCSSTEPEWGTISAILFGMSNAINMKPEMLQDLFIRLVEISGTITSTSLSFPSKAEPFYPHLSIFSQAIINNFNFEITREVILAITDHSLIGYLSDSSLVQILINNLDKVITICKGFDFHDLNKIATPMSSRSPNISNFYLALWSNIILEIHDNQFATKALRAHAASLTKHIDTYESSKFLLDMIKASPKEKEQLLKSGPLICKRVISHLKQPQNASESSTFQSAKSTKQTTSRFNIYKAQVAIIKSKLMSLRSKKWDENADLKLVEEASILFWSHAGNYVHKGVAVQCSDIEEMQLLKKEADKENVIKITIGSSKTSYLISLQNYVLASQWQNLIKQAKLSV
ncbi:hypothetical protein GPJ56_003009 [Histomonas meleagridis]|uniref:uncharacterized protein n=1 Tax=Histomonas meleagridis TaxID=135588 RepID=UPI00355A744F|nr:hypothetical protein GPJ56_003009 [Histomonas meleagridis]KAH0796665.1 hypothetical protein GO595_010558 [Histomonas meleagridis]